MISLLVRYSKKFSKFLKLNLFVLLFLIINSSSYLLNAQSSLFSSNGPRIFGGKSACNPPVSFDPQDPQNGSVPEDKNIPFCKDAISLNQSDPPGTVSTDPPEKINWVQSYNNNTNQLAKHVHITDNFSDGVGINPDLSSMIVPQGWSGTLTSSGFTIDSDNVTSPATGQSAVLNAPTNVNLSVTGGGDGFTPIIYKDSNGQNEVISFYHHWPRHTTDPWFQINCINISQTGFPKCKTNNSTYSYPQYLSSDINAPYSSAGGTQPYGDIYTTATPTPVIIGHKLFYAAQRQNDAGIGCFDINAAQNCGYYLLASDLPINPLDYSPGEVESLTEFGGHLYMIGNNMKMYCLDVSNVDSPVPCQNPYYDYNAQRSITTRPYGQEFIAVSTIINRKIYTLVNNDQFSLLCYDTSNEKACNNWDENKLEGYGFYPIFSEARSIFPYIDSNGTTLGVCVLSSVYKNGVLNSPVCLSFNDQSLLTYSNFFPSGIQAKGKTWMAYYNGINKNIYIPIWQPEGEPDYDNNAYGPSDRPTSGPYSGSTFCYSTTLQKPCPNFGPNGNGTVEWDTSGVTVGLTDPDSGNPAPETRDYGYLQIGNCMYGLGDVGNLWGFNPDTGGVCSKSFGSLTITPANYYCDEVSHTTTWDKIVIYSGGATGGTVSIRVTNGPTVLVSQEYQLSGSDHSIPLSSINTSEYPSLTVNISATGTIPNNLNVTTFYKGDDPQFCFKSIASSCPSNGEIKNISTATTTFATSISKSKAGAKLRCAVYPWFNISKSIAQSSNDYNIVNQNASDHHPTTITSNFSDSPLFTNGDNTNQLWNSTDYSGITSYGNLVPKYNDTNTTLSGNDFLAAVNTIDNSYITKIKPESNNPGIAGISVNNINSPISVNIDLSQISDKALPTRQGAVYEIIGDSPNNYNLNINYNLSDSTTKSGLIIYTNIQNTNITLNSNNQSVNSSVLLISSGNINVIGQGGDSNTPSYINKFNMGLVSSGLIDYQCINSASTCQTEQSGLTFSTGGVKIESKNKDTQNQPVAKITYSPNYITDFKKMFKINNIQTNLVGFNN